jgi:NO-binding membrane sensor protein with MHYT domain
VGILPVLRVITCVTTAHDLRLVVLAALICMVAAFASFRIYARATSNQALQGQQRHRLVWVGVTGLSTGAGIWSTHFVAMLAFDSGFPTAYDPTLTLMSLAIAIGITTAGYAIGAQRGEPAGAPYRFNILGRPITLHHHDATVASAGAVVGTGIAMMHYTGMAAVMVPGVLQWDTPYVVASLGLGMVLASASMVANSRLSPRQALWIAPGLLTLAICSLHFTAMAAATVVPDPAIVVHPSVMGTTGMAVTVTVITMLIMLAGISAAFVNAQRTTRSCSSATRSSRCRMASSRGNTLSSTSGMRACKPSSTIFPAALPSLMVTCAWRSPMSGPRRFSIFPDTCFSTALQRLKTCFASMQAGANMAPVTSRNTWPNAWDWRGPVNLMSSSASVPTAP